MYNTYQKELQQINERLAATINAYAAAYNAGPITNETAKKLTDEAAAIDDAEARLKTASSARFFATLPATKAARCIQIEIMFAGGHSLRARLEHPLGPIRLGAAPK